MMKIKTGEEHVAFRPQKRLGQNFLVDENIARKIFAALNVQKEDIILEIGPGSGVLTKFFLNKAKKVIGVEIDAKLVALLKEKFKEKTNFYIIHGDFLKIDLREAAEEPGKLRIVGNLPYYITSATIFKVLENKKMIQDMTIMVQREVAQRIVAAPGSKDYGVLSVLCQYFSFPEVLFYVSRNVFSPRPKVDAAVVRFEFSRAPRFHVRDERLFVRLVKACFGMRRKKLKNSLGHFLELSVDLKGIDFDLNQRPEQLSIEEWVRLSDFLSRVTNERNGFKRGFAGHLRTHRSEER